MLHVVILSFYDSPFCGLSDEMRPSILIDSSDSWIPARISDVPPGCHLVCWYQEFQRNPQDPHLPQVNVVLRSTKPGVVSPSTQWGFVVYSYDELASKTFFQERPFAVPYLGQLRIGTVITSDGVESVLDGVANFARQRRFAVNFSRDSWRFEDAGVFEKHFSDDPRLFPSALKVIKPRGPMLVFPLETRRFKRPRTLWIPCTEFFSRCYGRSQEIKRILSLYPWDRAKRRLFGSGSMPKHEGFDGWTIRLKRPFVPDDAVFLAHLRHDPYAEACAKSIYAQLEIAVPVVPDPLPWKSFVEVSPWFEGPAELLVRGYWYNDEKEKKFLALRVDGCSDPEGVPVGYIRSGFKKSSSGAGAKGNPIWYVRGRKVAGKVVLTDQGAPDRGSRTIRVEDPPFDVLGKPRVLEMIEEPGRNGDVRFPKGEEGDGPNYVSSSEPHSTGKGVDRVFLAPRVDRKSGNVLSDMWDTLLYLQKKRSDVVGSVGWMALDLESRFQHRQDEPPGLIPLEPFTFEEEKALPTGVGSWQWLDPEDLSLGRRGLLILRYMVEGMPIYFAEVERRLGRTENFSGMVFRLRPDASLDGWLHEVLSGIREVKGVFSKLCSGCPGEARDFIHLSRQDGTILYERAVGNALGKIGLYQLEYRVPGEGNLFEGLQ